WVMAIRAISLSLLLSLRVICQAGQQFEKFLLRGIIPVWSLQTKRCTAGEMVTLGSLVMVRPAIHLLPLRLYKGQCLVLVCRIFQWVMATVVLSLQTTRLIAGAIMPEGSWVMGVQRSD